MMNTDAPSVAARLHRSQHRALCRLLRFLRHEMATPLSGALLQGELARRRIGTSASGAAAENLRMLEEELSRLSALVELLGDLAKDPEPDAGEFSAFEALSGGASRHASEAAARGLELRLPDPAPGTRLLGSRPRVEEAVSEITLNACRHGEAGGVIEWTVEDSVEGTRLACLSSGRLPSVKPDQLFGLGDRAAEGRRFGLVRARWCVETQGGELTIGQAGPSVRVALIFPPAGE
jgi:signal transduction histidine kinase